ncbi:MATE family efflux transporter, partial [Salmonella enterica subsp. enterica serovar Virchow]|nr:MATE family efflux transporter [Salmonella enterica subsp. enterica serovar Virchow]
AVGRRDLHGARKVVGTAATFFFVVSVICAALGWVYCEAILRLLATPDDVLPLAVDYLRVIFLAVPGMNFLAFLMSVLRGAGDSRTPFWFMFLSVVLDIILNPLLIGGYGPFPAMGIAGSALATLVGSLVPLVGLIVTIYWRNDPLRLAGPDFVLLKPDPAMLRVIISKGVPIGLQMVVISVSALTLMGMVNSYGTHVTAAYGVAAQLWTYVQMPAMAIGAGVSSMAAQNIGAGRWDRVGQITRAGVTFNLVLTTLLVGVLFLFDRHMLGWFLPASSESIDVAVHINNYVSWSFIFFGVTIVLFSTVRSTGAVLPPLLILAFSTLLVRTGFAYGMRGYFGQDALWISFPVGNLTSLVLAILYYRYGGWRRANVDGAEESPVASQAPDTGFGQPCSEADPGRRARQGRDQRPAMTSA